MGKCPSSDASLSLGAARAAPISWPLCRDDGNQASSRSLVASPQSSRPGEGGPGQGGGEGNGDADAALKKTKWQQVLRGNSILLSFLSDWWRGPYPPSGLT